MQTDDPTDNVHIAPPQQWRYRLRRLAKLVDNAQAAVDAARELALLRPELPPVPETDQRLADARAEYDAAAAEYPEAAAEYEARLRIEELRKHEIPAVRKRIEATRPKRTTRKPPTPARIAELEARIVHHRQRSEHWASQGSDPYYRLKAANARNAMEAAQRTLDRLQEPMPPDTRAEHEYEKQVLAQLEAEEKRLLDTLHEPPLMTLVETARDTSVTSDELVHRLWSNYQVDDDGQLVSRRTGLPMVARNVKVLGHTFTKDEVIHILGGRK